ncbi:MAG: hypothetical protein JSW24_01600 [Dehalococcoidia bacterium]|nr:MAG: hypothetical protein JSW24_01600 [Dehalococcoidia bacterium]
MWRRPFVRLQDVVIRWKPLAIGLGSALAFLLVFCLAPVKAVSYTVDEKYQTTETYYVSELYTREEPYVETEPYTDIETYYEKEPYEEAVPIDYVVTGEEGYNYFGGGGFYVRVYIKNTDVIGGDFTVLFDLTLHGGAKTTESKTKYIAAGKEEKLTISYHGAALSFFTYSVTPPVKTVTAYRTVEKTREVINYRPVIKYREITEYRCVPQEMTVCKTRPVTRWKRVSMLEYLRSY